jgi:hypothetical protein
MLPVWRRGLKRAALSDEGRCFHSMMSEENEMYVVRLTPTSQVCKVDISLRLGIVPGKRVSDHYVRNARVSYREVPSIYYLIRVSPGMTGLRQSSEAPGARPSPWLEVLTPARSRSRRGKGQRMEARIAPKKIWQREAARPAGTYCAGISSQPELKEETRHIHFFTANVVVVRPY